jgi:hypothetical protein
VLSRPNGFAIERLAVFQDCWPFDQWYVVRDPEEVRRRVTLLNRHPAFLVVRARKIEEAPLFSSPPQQSDYVAVWNDTANGRGTSTPPASTPRPSAAVMSMARRTIGRLVPQALKRRYQLWRAGGIPFDPAFYDALDDRPRADLGPD